MGLAPSEVALRDAILAVLRDRPVAHTADMLRPLMPRRCRWMTQTPSGFCAGHHQMLKAHPEVRLLECRGTGGHLVSELPSPNIVLHHLAALHSLGYVQRFAPSEHGVATWMWIEPALVPGRSAEIEVALKCEAILAAAGPWRAEP